ncbi:glycosyltransferase family 2 protein [Anaeromyxobacter oryzae]|uniref:glycosyltransferase family 2 protein n=1 Tax=Anaeromyxobacter oryzae TaxID=2918170 RepID=UPI0020BEB582|nr:glycosyltransferase family 2 protein [Anaeromyxobacter oryzae]
MHTVSVQSPHPGAAREQPRTLEVVIPVYNEAEVIDLLLERLAGALSPDKLGPLGITRARLLFVDDGSTDETAELLAERIASGLDARLVRFSRNFGHQSAVCAGLDRAEGDVVVIMDADLQDPPELLVPMLERWRAGADVVFARRRRRRGNVLKRLGYWGFYRMVAFLSDIRLPLDTGDFGAMDRRVVLALRSLPERLRFPRGLRAWVGFRQEAVEFDRPERQAGTTKYAWSKLYRLATDGIAAMSTRPLQAAQIGSFFFGLLTLGFLGMLVTGYLTRPSSIPTPFLLAYVLIATGNAVQSFCLYILGAYVGRTYLEVKARPPYLVMEVVERPPDVEGSPS